MKTTRTQNLIAAALVGVSVSTAVVAGAAGPLPSWNEGAAKKSITAFIEKVTKQSSPGGIEFMRPWTEKVYGIPPEQVVGSSIKTKYEVRDGKPVIVKLPELNFYDDKGDKPVGIQRHIGRRPLAAFGNSDGDLQMLQWTAAGSGPRFCLYVHHDDAQREVAYDRQSHIGRLDKGLDEAAVKGWAVVSMKDDWKTVFPAAAPFNLPAGEETQGVGSKALIPDLNQLPPIQK